MTVLTDSRFRSVAAGFADRTASLGNGRHAADLVGVRPDEAVHVGDLYSVDVLGARAAGCQAILIDPVGAWVGVDCPTATDIQAAGRLVARMI